MPKLKTKVATALVLIVCNANCALAVSTSEYLTATEEFKQGYIFGIMETLTLVADSDAEQTKRDLKLLQCFQENKINPAEGVRIVGRYILRTPDASTTPMLAVAIRAFNEACERYLK